MKVWRQEKIPTSSIIASRRTIAHRQRCQVRLRSYVKEIKRKVTTVDGESEIIKSYLWLTFRHLAPAHSLKITKCHPGISPFRHQVIMLSGHHIAMSSCRIWKPSHLRVTFHSFETLGGLRGRMWRRPRWRVSPSTSLSLQWLCCRSSFDTRNLKLDQMQIGDTRNRKLDNKTK